LQHGAAREHSISIVNDIPTPLLWPSAPSTLEPSFVAGVDEVGRGALFGPVVAAAVVVSPGACRQLQELGVTDSKRLTPKRRQQLVGPIQSLAIDWSIGLASVQEIDRVNILQATFLAMERAVRRLSCLPHRCLIDGNREIPHLTVPQRAVVRGDQIHGEIAAASILAKVWRDTLMVRLDRRYPGYGLASHKGYGSAAHRRAIQTLGPTPQHRRSFKGCQ
jgi:ribonuclease HII